MFLVTAVTTITSTRKRGFFAKQNGFAYHHKDIRKSNQEVSYSERPYACANKESHTAGTQ